MKLIKDRWNKENEQNEYNININIINIKKLFLSFFTMTSLLSTPHKKEFLIRTELILPVKIGILYLF